MVVGSKSACISLRLSLWGRRKETRGNAIGSLLPKAIGVAIVRKLLPGLLFSVAGRPAVEGSSQS